MEKLPSRREADKTNYEQTEKYQAIETMTEIGMLTRMNELDLFHGRAGNGQPWRVEPGFNNAGNNTGNHNVNKTPALNTSEWSIASEFAARRARGKGLNPEVHEIVSDDPDARIIDAMFDYDSIGEYAKTELKKAIRQTLPRVMEAVPVDFEERERIDQVLPKDFMANRRDGLFYAKEIRENAARLHLSNKVTHSIASAMNTRRLLGTYPGVVQSLMIAYVENNDSIGINEEGVTKELPISREYLASWFHNNHIVGCKILARSATLGGKEIDNYLLFDLEKVNTSAEEERKAKLRNKRLGKIAMAAMKNEQKPTERNELIASLEDNLYIKPEKIVSLAEKTPGYREIFEADAGNWEGYKLAEHTETVLRLFDDNYADIMPAATLPIMRMALLVHDVGKPVAVKNHEKEHQAAYNQVYAEDFMRKNGVDEKNQKLILAMIGEGSIYAKWWGVDHRQVDEEFYHFCEQTMQEYLGTKHVDRHTVTGFRDMLMVLQTCDSAAYTTMAVTRNRDTGVRYRNYGAFNKSFEDYHGLTGRRAKLK